MTAEQNVGHGWVFPRPDGMKARCGGPAICSECATDLARQQASDRTIVTRTITGVPIWLNSERLLVDAVVTVDFTKIAAERACNAYASKRKKSMVMGDAIVVQATNVREQPKS